MGDRRSQGASHELRNIQTEQTVALMKNTDALDMLERHPDKVSGAWVFKGTRVPVSALFENLKDGASIDQFLEWFPGVARTQVEALLDHELKQFEPSARA